MIEYAFDYNYARIRGINVCIKCTSPSDKLNLWNRSSYIAFDYWTKHKLHYILISLNFMINFCQASYSLAIRVILEWTAFYHHFWCVCVFFAILFKNYVVKYSYQINVFMWLMLLLLFALLLLFCFNVAWLINITSSMAYYHYRIVYSVINYEIVCYSIEFFFAV